MIIFDFKKNQLNISTNKYRKSLMIDCGLTYMRYCYTTNTWLGASSLEDFRKIIKSEKEHIRKMQKRLVEIEIKEKYEV